MSGASVNNPKCRTCGGTCKRNGTTSSGSQRWRCKSCGASFTHKIDNSAKQLKMFLDWLLSKKSQSELKCSPATFRRIAVKYWNIWPLAPYTGEIHDVVFMDGIWLSRNLVVLIACTKKHVLAWYPAQSECSGSWAALMSKLAPPKMLVSDGGTGLAKAARALWPNTRIQRCTFHTFNQVKRCTTTRPKLDCGKELYGIARKLLKVNDADSAAIWLASYAEWCSKWEKFLREFTLKDGKKQYTHEQLRKARRGLNKLVQEQTLFTFIDMAEEHGGKWDATSNMIEGGINALLREMLRNHRGLSTERRLKAIFWWCYMHTECPLPPSEIIKTMPTDDEIEGIFVKARSSKDTEIGPVEWGSGIVWNELHHATKWRG